MTVYRKHNARVVCMVTAPHRYNFFHLLFSNERTVRMAIYANIVQISSLVAIANCCISRGHTETADFYFADEEKTPKDEKLLTVFERFFFSEDDDLCMASLESACRILYYCGGCFSSVLSCCLLRCFSPKCPSRTHEFLTFFLGMYHAKSRSVIFSTKPYSLVSVSMDSIRSNG
ncbi:hypothetical protein Tcan_09918 [Toxocara canis]|uniref:Uncharacterized protein n=1 Tax=Toxocara canis TaxID=6265 RepID=A0A0B2V1X2_TOXCA|nr:hypothetical protein Tcan_09918 [Toxocara canis]